MTAVLRPWLGVLVDASVTLVLLALGLDPVFQIVSTHRYPAAIILGILHTIIVPWTLVAGMMNSSGMDLFVEKKGRMIQAFESFFLLSYVLGWMLPIFSFSLVPSIPSALFYSCIFSHVAPLFLFLGMALLGQGERADRLALWVARQVGPLALLVALYMAVAEVFFLLMRGASQRIAPMAFVSWFLAYLPLRLFLARLTGLRRPDWISLLISMTFLLIRLALTSPR